MNIDTNTKTTITETPVKRTNIMSRLFTWNNFDIVKTFVIGGVSTGITALYTILNNEGLPTSSQWYKIILISLVASASQLLTSLSTNSDGKLLKKDPLSKPKS